MIVVARNMHLDKETTWTKRKKKKSNNLDRSRNELKRMLWWEIVFYDMYGLFFQFLPGLIPFA